MERELKAKLLSEIAQPDETVIEENTYTLMVCDGKNHYRISVDEQRTFYGACSCPADKLLEGILQPVQIPNGVSGSNYDRWSQLENFIQDANVCVLLIKKLPLTIGEVCGIIADDIQHLAKLDAGFSPRITELAQRLKNKSKGGD